MNIMAEISQKPLVVLPGPASDAPGETGVERREHDRYPLTASTEIIDIQSGARLLGRTSDLSASGCYIETQSPFPKNTTVRLRLEHNRQKIETTAVVVYSLAPMGMGLTFKEMRPDQLEILKSWMPQSNGEPSHERGNTAAAPNEETKTIVSNPDTVLFELIHLMVRKKIITEKEATGLLRQMFQ
jgi:hypothetical protein